MNSGRFAATTARTRRSKNGLKNSLQYIILFLDRLKHSVLLATCNHCWIMLDLFSDPLTLYIFQKAVLYPTMLAYEYTLEFGQPEKYNFKGVEE